MRGRDELAIHVEGSCGISPLCELQHRAIAAEEIRVTRALFAAMFGQAPKDMDGLAVTRCHSDCQGRYYKRIPIDPSPQKL